MDVGELLAFKPTTAPKRPAPKDEKVEVEEDDPNDSYEARAKKRKMAKRRAQEAANRAREEERMNMLEEEARQARINQEGKLTSDQREKIAELVDSGEALENVQLDETGVKRILLNFEKKVLKNQELRIKFLDQPEKFMESEMELHDTVQELHNIATVPEHYPILVELNTVPSLLGLLSHENSDISVAVVDLLQELTDVDVMTGSEEGASSFIQALLDNQVCALLVSNLDRLDESVREEADGVHNSLAIVENIVEFRPEVCKEVATQGSGFLTWLVKKLKVKVPFDPNKLYASEILSILLQNEPENRQSIGEMEAIDSLLQQLAYYKRHNPNTSEEAELMENLFDCLCSCLMHLPNRDRFLRGEGLQLMNLMLREKKVSRTGALKVLDHALIGSEGTDNCIKLIDILGLRTLFPLFMKTPKKSQRAGTSAEEYQEHVISILASLLKNCTAGNGASKQRERLLSKFTENDHEKVDRLMELHANYLLKVKETDSKIEKEIRKTRGTEDELTDDEIYLKRLDGGLFTLQLVDFIILEVCSSAASTVKQRVLQILQLRGGSIKTVRNIVREYAGNLGDDEDGDSEKKSEQDYLLNLVDKF